MRLTRLIPLFGLLILTACGEPPQAPDGTPTLAISGIPTFEKPIGLLPGKPDATGGPVPTLPPAPQTPSQQVFMPDLGLRLTIPADWSSKHVSDRTLIQEAGGSTVIEAGQAFGFSGDADTMSDQLNELMLAEGFNGANFEIRQSVVNVYNYVVVSGPEVDACEYAYLSVGLSWLGLKFDRSLCNQDGRLNDTAFAILKSLRYTGPTQ